MKLIVNADKNWGIGAGNDLLYHIPADMKFFKEHTVGNVVIMGKATVESLPGGQPLKDRITLALCDEPEWHPEGVEVFDSVPALLEGSKQYDTDRVYVCGGASVYAQMLEYCDTAYVTKVDADDKDAQKFFPNLDENPAWVLTESSENMEHKGISFKFTTYEKIK